MWDSTTFLHYSYLNIWTGDDIRIDWIVFGTVTLIIYYEGHEGCGFHLLLLGLSLLCSTIRIVVELII